MSNNRPLYKIRYLWAAILPFFILGFRSSNVTTSIAAHEQSNLAWPTRVMEGRPPLFIADVGEESAPQDRTRGKNPGLPLTLKSSAFAVNFLSYYMPPQNVGPLAVSGNYAYVSELSDINVIDVSNPLSPTLVSTYQSGEEPFGPVAITISGTVGYVAYSSADLQVLDISQPTNPTLIGSYDGAGYAGYAGMMRIKNYVYLTTTDCSLLIIDVFTDANPKVVGCWNEVQNINAMFADNRYAYVAESLGSPSIVHVLDIANPINPTIISSIPQPWPISNIVSTGDYLYIVNLHEFYIIDISSPLNPQTIAIYPVGCRDAQLVGHYLYLAYGGVRIMDISNPVRPIQVGQGRLPSTSGEAAYVVVVGQHVYMTDTNAWAMGIKLAGGLAIFEVYEMTNPIYLPVVRR